MKTTMESDKSVSPSLNWVGGATLNVLLPLALVINVRVTCCHACTDQFRGAGDKLHVYNIFLRY